MNKNILFFSIILASDVNYTLCASSNPTEQEVTGKEALIVVDVQHDFLEGGSLGVAEANGQYCHWIQVLTNMARRYGNLIVATQDSHVKGHISFASTHHKQPFTSSISAYTNKIQQLWPDHCVMGTEGHKIAIPLQDQDIIIQKGTDKNYDSYSGFADDGGKETKLHDILQKHKVKFLTIVGIATDYCVYHTALDALKRGYQVRVIVSGCRGVTKEGSIAALKNLQRHGANLIYLELLPNPIKLRELEDAGLSVRTAIVRLCPPANQGMIAPKATA